MWREHPGAWAQRGGQQGGGGYQGHDVAFRNRRSRVPSSLPPPPRPALPPSPSPGKRVLCGSCPCSCATCHSQGLRAVPATPHTGSLGPVPRALHSVRCSSGTGRVLRPVPSRRKRPHPERKRERSTAAPSPQPGEPGPGPPTPSPGLLLGTRLAPPRPSLPPAPSPSGTRQRRAPRTGHPLPHDVEGGGTRPRQTLVLLGKGPRVRPSPPSPASVSTAPGRTRCSARAGGPATCRREWEQPFRSPREEEEAAQGTLRPPPLSRDQPVCARSGGPHLPCTHSAICWGRTV